MAVGTGKSVRYFDIAKRVALKSEFDRAPTGCVVVYKNKVIGTGRNFYKTHPLQKKYNRYRTFDEHNYPYIRPSVHAEIAALSSLIDNPDINWSKVDIYIYRCCKSREFGLARPCAGCMQLIRDLGIKNVYYTTDYGVAHEEIL